MDTNIRSGPKALLIGATGLVGRYCLEGLLEDPQYSEVIALVRKPCNVEHPKLREVLTDFKNIGENKCLKTVKLNYSLYMLRRNTARSSMYDSSFRTIRIIVFAMQFHLAILN